MSTILFDISRFFEKSVLKILRVDFYVSGKRDLLRKLRETFSHLQYASFIVRVQKLL